MTTSSSPSLDLIAAKIRFLVLIIRFVPVGFFVFFIALLIDVPTDIGGDRGGLDWSDISNDTDDLADLVVVISVPCAGLVFVSWVGNSTPRAATLAKESVVPVSRDDEWREPQFGAASCRLLMSSTSVVTVVCSCLISSLYLSSFSCALLWVSIKCCMMSFIVTSLGASLFLSLLGIGLPSAWRLVSLPSFSALLVNILVAVGETLFLGVASTDAESESLVNRLSRLGGLPSAPPCGPSLFLFSAWSPSLVLASRPRTVAPC
ncbi:hypothetical protein KCU67_g54, partial [Aureobasidium melanogenum]